MVRAICRDPTHAGLKLSAVAGHAPDRFAAGVNRWSRKPVNRGGGCSASWPGWLEPRTGARGPSPGWLRGRAGAPPGTFVARWPGMPTGLEGQAFCSRLLYSAHEGAWSPDRVEQEVRARGGT